MPLWRPAIPEICEIVDGPVSAEVVATEYEAMLKKGRTLAKLYKNVVVKVPLTADGLRAVGALEKETIRPSPPARAKLELRLPAP